MIRSLRKRHLEVWTMAAVLIPLSIVSAVVVRPHFPKDKLRQPVAEAGLPLVVRTLDKAAYRVSIRSNADTSVLQVEWTNKSPLTYPTAAIYEATGDEKLISDASLIGRIEGRGTYYFPLKRGSLRSKYHLIVYDFIHQRIIESITF
jgi:hypothetical protein